MLFVILGYFLPFYPLTCPKNEHFKMKKMPGDIIILHKCTKNHDHTLYYSWDMVRDRCNCYFSFWAIFCPFTYLRVQKIKISKKWKKRLEISSFYTCISKIMIWWCKVPEIWCATDGQTNGKRDTKVGAPPSVYQHISYYSESKKERNWHINYENPPNA